ncbi:S24/S26 family peptidase [Marinomonas epiphytica]
MFNLIKVDGDSMSPTLMDGDYVLTARWYRRLKVGQIVVIDHALYGVMVKKILHVAPDGQLWLGGENPQSLLSERIGWVSPRRVLGKVLTHFGKTKPAAPQT